MKLYGSIKSKVTTEKGTKICMMINQIDSDDLDDLDLEKYILYNYTLEIDIKKYDDPKQQKIT